jgi:hypothetical protein
MFKNQPERWEATRNKPDIRNTYFLLAVYILPLGSMYFTHSGVKV